VVLIQVKGHGGRAGRRWGCRLGSEGDGTGGKLIHQPSIAAPAFRPSSPMHRKVR